MNLGDLMIEVSEEVRQPSSELFIKHNKKSKGSK